MPHNASLGPVELSFHDNVAVVTLDDPDHRNPLNDAMVAAIGQAFDLAEARPEINCAVITGRGRAFCAGAELRVLEDSVDGDFSSVDTVYEGFLRVLRSPLPTVAAVNGPAVGAGMNLALACDVRIAGAHAKFDTRFTALRLHPGGGHTWLLARAVGNQRATAAVLFGEQWDATGAATDGLALRVVPHDELIAHTISFAQQIATVDRSLIERLIGTLREVRELPTHAEALAWETAAQRWSVGEPDFVKTVRALRESISTRPNDVR